MGVGDAVLDGAKITPPICSQTDEPGDVGGLVVAEALDDVVPGAVGGANLDADGVPVDGHGLGGGEGLGVGSALGETTEKLGAVGEEALLVASHLRLSRG